MPSITFWNRLEPRPRGAQIERTLSAEVRDPLWFLTRQWQLGEFQGEDGGSPSHVAIESETFALGGTAAGDTSLPLDPSRPLEPQVQAEVTVPDLTMRVEMAQLFARLAPGVDLAPFRARYPLPAAPTPEDPDAARFRRYVAGRGFDGFALYLDIVAGRPVPGSPPATAVTAFRAWVDGTFGRLAASPAEAPTWRPKKLDHAFTARATDGAGGEITFDVTPGPDGTVDWDGFDVTGVRAPTMPAPAATSTVLVPAQLRFPGMPSPRYWDFEQGRTNFSDVIAERRDVPKLVTLHMMLVQGLDWFLVHLPVPLGHVCRVRGLKVTDVFEETTLVPRGEERASTGRGRFVLFGASSSAAGVAPDVFVLPASVGGARQRGEPIEEVRFGRDEMANMAFAVERTVEGGTGRPWPGRERAQALVGSPPPPPDGQPDTSLVYRVDAPLSAEWFPFLPAKVAGDQIALVAARVEGRPADAGPAGRVLRPTALAGAPYTLFEEEIPREGVEVRRVPMRARWTDGSTVVWIERHRALAGGDAPSGLRWDQALPTNE